MSGKQFGMANGNCFLQGNLAKISSRKRFVNSLTCHLDPPWRLREHSLPVSADIVLYSSGFPYFLLPVSAAVMLFSRVVLARFSEYFLLPVTAVVLFFFLDLYSSGFLYFWLACTPSWMCRNKMPFRMSTSVTQYFWIGAFCSTFQSITRVLREKLSERSNYTLKLWAKCIKILEQWVEYQLELSANKKASKQWQLVPWELGLGLGLTPTPTLMQIRCKWVRRE